MATEGPGPALPSCPPFPRPWAPWGDAQSLSPAHPKAQASPVPCMGSALPCPLKSQGESLNFSFSTWFSRRRGLGHGGASSVTFMQFGAALVCQALECVAGGWGSASAHSQGKPGLGRRKGWGDSCLGAGSCRPGSLWPPSPGGEPGPGKTELEPPERQGQMGTQAVRDTVCACVCVLACLCSHAGVCLHSYKCASVGVHLWCGCACFTPPCLRTCVCMCESREPRVWILGC